mmetsp:Transcript_10504/g.15664  ORF Transcript_10504/g.15664 Transcript_10504/m.15664 type:complete len:785 (+) Transcript_10504:55-2409(+)
MRYLLFVVALALAAQSLRPEKIREKSTLVLRTNTSFEENRRLETTFAKRQYEGNASRGLQVTSAALSYVVFSIVIIFAVIHATSSKKKKKSNSTKYNCNSCGNQVKKCVQSVSSVSSSYSGLPEIPNAAQVVNWAKQQSFGIDIVRGLFHKMGRTVHTDGTLSREECENVFKLLGVSRRILSSSIRMSFGMEHLDDLMVKYSPDIRDANEIPRLLTAPELLTFLNDVQGSNCELEDCEEIIKAITGGYRVIRKLELVRLLTNQHPMYNNFWFDISKFQEVSERMDQPLSQYYISCATSILDPTPDTPLAGLTAIQKALLMGSRCINLVTIDSKNGRPQLAGTGGRHATAIPVEKAVQAIKRCAFLASRFPCMLAIENHCSKEQTGEVVRVIRRVLGRALALPHEFRGKPSPSPTSLLERFLIFEIPRDFKSRPRFSTASSTLSTDPFKRDKSRDVSIQEEKARKTKHTEEDMNKETAPLCSSLRNSCLLPCPAPLLSSITFFANKDDNRQSEQRDSKEPLWRGASSALDSSSTIPRIKWIDQRSLERHEDLKNVRISEITRVKPSFDLTVADSKASTKVQALMNSRVQGVNIHPVRFGGGGTAMQLNYGWFQSNGSCGYLLKPERKTFLSSEDKKMDDSKTESPVVRYPRSKVTINAISGHFLPSSSSNYLAVQFEFFAPARDLQDQKVRYTTSEAKGSLMPAFGNINDKKEKGFQFSTTTPEQSMIMIRVLNTTYSKIVAQSCASVDSLLPGYRIVPLYSADCKPVFGFLFVRIWIETDSVTS